MLSLALKDAERDADKLDFAAVEFDRLAPLDQRKVLATFLEDVVMIEAMDAAEKADDQRQAARDAVELLQDRMGEELPRLVDLIDRRRSDSDRLWRSELPVSALY